MLDYKVVNTLASAPLVKSAPMETPNEKSLKIKKALQFLQTLSIICHRV